MEISQKKLERMQNIKDAFDFKEPKKVPIHFQAINWPFAYAGTTYKAVMDDPMKTVQAYTKYLDDMEFDFAQGMGVRTPIKIFPILESDLYYLADDDTCIAHDQGNEKYMSLEDYDLLIEDPSKIFNGLMLRNRFPIFNKPREEAKIALKKALKELDIFMNTNRLIQEKFDEKDIVLGAPMAAPYYYSAFNWIFAYCRGMKNALIDLHRIRDKVKQACDSIYAQNWSSRVQEVSKTDVEEIKRDIAGNPLPLSGFVYHSEPFLSPKDFDEFFFKPFKKAVTPYIEAGVKYFQLGEGRFLSTLDRFKELPKGSILIWPEKDDPFEAYKIIGDHQAIMTGPSLEGLKYKTKAEVIDYTKKCFDTFAPGGGFVFSVGPTPIAANDVNIDNLLSVYEFANEYGKKR